MNFDDFPYIGAHVLASEPIQGEREAAIVKEICALIDRYQFPYPNEQPIPPWLQRILDAA